MADEAYWYVAHTYSGYEDKVKANIEKTIENRNLQDQIFEVSVPKEEVYEETKSGVKKKVLRKTFPGYVFVQMIMNEDTWYVVRNTRGVTGFVGPGSKPVPLSETEIRNIRGLEDKEEIVEIDFAVGDLVTITSGVWENTQGAIKSINMGKRTVIISVDMFGRETPVELSFSEIRVEH